MKTSKAIRLLEKGRKVRRKSWEEQDDYIYLDEKGSLRHSNGNRYSLQHHITRADWEEYKVKGDKRTWVNYIVHYLKCGVVTLTKKI